MSKSGGSSSSPYPMKSFASGGSSSKNQQSDGPFVYKAKGNTKFKPKKLVVSKSSAKGDQNQGVWGGSQLHQGASSVGGRNGDLTRMERIWQKGRLVMPPLPAQPPPPPPSPFPPPSDPNDPRGLIPLPTRLMEAPVAPFAAFCGVVWDELTNQHPGAPKEEILRAARDMWKEWPEEEKRRLVKRYSDQKVFFSPIGQ